MHVLGRMMAFFTISVHIKFSLFYESFDDSMWPATGSGGHSNIGRSREEVVPRNS